jgi:hypothetical protein
MNSENSDEKLDMNKRETLRILARAAWVTPVVASFALNGLSVSSAWADIGNSTAS